jgi:anti-anti-sigma factor
MPPTTVRGDEPQALVPGLRFVSDPPGTETTRLTFIGELDLATAARAAARIRRAQTESHVLICDLSGIWFLDITGIRVLLEAAAYADHSDRRLLVANAPSVLSRMLRLLEMEHALEVPAHPLPARAVRRCASVRSHSASPIRIRPCG